MIQQKTKSQNIKETNIKKHYYSKKVLLWMKNNLKFLLIPGYNLEELELRRKQYEIHFPKKHLIKSYKSLPLIISFLILFTLFTLAFFSGWISPYTYFEATIPKELWIDREQFAPPSPEHPLGQTFLGLDVLARIIFGVRPVLIFSLATTLVASLIGIFIGAISAYFGGWLDAICMRLMDLILSFPGVVFAIVFILIWGTDFITLIWIYSIIGTPYFARLIRTNVLKEKELPYVVAGRVSGAKNFRLLFRHILPNCLQPYLVAASFNITRNILSLGVLGFLRFGSIGWIEWGFDIAISLDSRYITYAPWAVFYPAVMILLSGLGFLLFGDAMADERLIRKEAL